MSPGPTPPLPAGGGLCIVVIGASGDLAMRKIYPALFALYCQKLLPDAFHIAGFARTAFSRDDFHARIARHLTCRYTPGEQCGPEISAFLERCSYRAGDYDDAGAFRALDKELRALGGDQAARRVYYLAIPPFLFETVADALADAGGTAAAGEAGWPRVVIEKPFGSDRASSDALTQRLARVFQEEQTYRIDHYLGKAVVQNLLVLRFANLVFDPLWNRQYIEHVRISWMEDIGLEGRAGYFDEYGIIRDVMQNHLLQILALTAMEPPVSLESRDIRDEKVKVLRCIPPVGLEDLAVGQYTRADSKGAERPGYAEEEGVPRDSRTPTYAAAVLAVRNRRWDGVPFLLRAGKGLNARMTEIRIRFRQVPGMLFARAAGHLSPNELVIRVQPDEGITFRTVSRIPGLRLELDETELDLSYAKAFAQEIPDAYETLLLDVLRGDRSLFIRADELEAAWDVFTPALHALEQQGIRPRGYPFGGTGPAAAEALAARYNATW